MKNYIKERYIVLIIAFWAFASFYKGFSFSIFFFGLIIIVIWLLLFGVRYQYTIKDIKNKQINK